MATTERVYPLIRLRPGPIQGEAKSIVSKWVDGFNPLDFEAARKAKAWLETNLATEQLPLDSYFVFNDRDEDELYGFMVLDEIQVRVAPNDIPIMQVRHAIEDPYADSHPATKIAWIARSACSPPGFGTELFEHALLEATRARSCALMVDAYDERTAEDLWIRHYDLRRPREGGEGWSSLWHPVGQADQTFG